MIQSLPDQWIDAEKVRELLHWREVIEQTPIRPTEAHLIALLHALLTPPLPTLADMTHEERKACQWMQADFHGSNGELRVVITKSNGATVDVLLPSGAVSCVYADTLTPLPGEPKLKWPGGDVEDVPVADDDEPVMMPRPEDVKPGDPWLVEFDGDEWVGTRESRVENVCSWALARLDGADYTVARDDEITLVSRLVREPQS